jgi:hypothetical protein
LYRLQPAPTILCAVGRYRAATLAKEANSRIVKLSLDFEEDGHLLDFSFQEEGMWLLNESLSVQTKLEDVY